jgi:hypothetical protein
MHRPSAINIEPRIFHHRKFIHKMLDDYTRRPSRIGSRELEVNGGSRHPARDSLRTSSSGTSYGEGVALGSPWRTSLSNGIKVDTTIVRANRHQGGVTTPMNHLRSHGIHLETSLIKARRQLSTSPGSAEHDIAKNLSGGGQHYQLVAHL